MGLVYKLGHRDDFHFFHHSAPVNLDGFFRYAEVERDLLVEFA